MMITESSKQVIPFGPQDAKRVGEGCFYLDLIVWLNGDRIELGERVGFNYGCYVNGYGGLRIGHRTIVGPIPPNDFTPNLTGSVRNLGTGTIFQ